MKRGACSSFMRATVSDGRGFGDPGFYFTVLSEPGEVWVRYVRTMKEQLSLRVQGDAIAASHRFAVFGMPYLELRYDIARKAADRGGVARRRFDR